MSDISENFGLILAPVEAKNVAFPPCPHCGVAGDAEWKNADTSDIDLDAEPSRYHAAVNIYECRRCARDFTRAALSITSFASPLYHFNYDNCAKTKDAELWFAAETDEFSWFVLRRVRLWDTLFSSVNQNDNQNYDFELEWLDLHFSPAFAGWSAADSWMIWIAPTLLKCWWTHTEARLLGINGKPV